MDFLTPSDDTYRRILGLRAIRSYSNEPISPEHVEAILEAGRWTGSSKNTQRWIFIVVDGRDGLDRLATAGDFTKPLRAATLAIVLVRPGDGYEFDIGRAAQNMMQAAAALGIASCPITLHHDDVAHQVLDVPDDHQCRYAIAFGYADAKATASDQQATRTWGMSGRKPREAVARRGTFGHPW